MRAYTGVSLNGVTDPRARANMLAMDLALKDTINSLSPTGSTEPSTSMTAVRAASYVVMALSAALPNERQLAVATPLTLTDGGVGANVTLGVTFAAPTIALGTAASAGVANSLIRSDATILAFDVTVPSALAASAATGSQAVAARRDHVHIFPATLQSTGTVTTLALTSSAAATNILTSNATTNFDIGGPANLRPTATNATNLGTSARRWLSLAVGNNGISNLGNLSSVNASFTDVSTGTISVNDGVSQDWFPAADGVVDLGETSTPLAWRNCNLTGAVRLRDAGVANFYLGIASDSSSDLSADRTLTLDVSNASRTLHIDGDAIISQDYSTAGEPQFTSVQVLDAGTAFYLKLASNSAAPGGNFSADRTLTIDAQNASRTLTISGDAHISQNYSTAGTPQLAKLGIGAAADATRLLSVNDATSAPSTSSAAVLSDYYGSGGTIYLSDPANWLFVRVGAASYKIPLYS